MDQANTLRHLLGQRSGVVQPVICDATDNSGIGVCHFFTQAVAQAGLSILMLDGSRQGLSQMRQVRTKYELSHVLAGDVSLEHVCQSMGGNQWLLPAKRGMQAIQDKPRTAPQFLQNLHRLPVNPDVMSAFVSIKVLDAAMALNGGTGTWYWIVSPTSQSVTSVYAGLKYIATRLPDIEHRLIVTDVEDCAQADHVFSNLTDACYKFLEAPLDYAGFLPENNRPDFHEAGKRVAAAMMARLGNHALA